MGDTIALALHGGAGSIPGGDYSTEEAHMRGLIEEGRDRLRAGASALDVVVALTRGLEASGLYLAGKGAAPNRDGVHELDACVMDGAAADCGAVAALVGFESPVEIARDVMENTPHVMLAGAGASAFAADRGHAPIPAAPEAYYTRRRRRSASPADELAHDTVGVVARDGEGRLAAATSTAGVYDKLPGRVGDSPIIAAGAWADAHVAVSCTGKGEYFIRAAAAHDVSARMRYAGAGLDDAAHAVLDRVKTLGGSGGLIAVDASGAVTLPFISTGMKRAWLAADGAPQAAVF